jgi:hypothetical protein
MSQVAPSLHDTLPLAPRVIVHVEPPEQSMLQELPQVPLHVLSSVQLSVQLLPAQLEPSMSQAVPASHAHEVPVHVGGEASLPQAANARSKIASERMRIAVAPCNRHTRIERRGTT